MVSSHSVLYWNESSQHPFPFAARIVILSASARVFKYTPVSGRYDFPNNSSVKHNRKQGKSVKSVFTV